MKIQCDACEKAEAAVLCCADEAALCWSCDEKVHAANKLAEKHQRVLLVPNRNHNQNQSHPSCDICQEKAGYFFCLEDRALLCRQCDVSIHSSTSYVSSHQRFLLTGVKLDVDDFQNQHRSINSPSNAVHLNSPNPNHNTTITSNNKRSWDTFSSETNFGIQPHWPSDEAVMATTTNNNNNNASTEDFDDCYEFSPSDFGCSSISSK